MDNTSQIKWVCDKWLTCANNILPVLLLCSANIVLFYAHSWQFRSEGNDIGFGVFKRTADTRQKASEMEELMKSERVNSHMVPENGEMPCPEPGTCKLPSYTIHVHWTYICTHINFVYIHIEGGRLFNSINSMLLRCVVDVLRFDNTYSWVNAKKLQYLVEIHNPDEGKELTFFSTNL